MIYAHFEIILVPKDNGNQNSDGSCTNKCQIHVACSYGYKLVYVNDKFSKHFKPFLAVYNFINIIIEESKYCSDVMKKHYNKELIMTKKDNEDF